MSEEGKGGIHLDLKTIFKNKWLLLLAILGVVFILVGTFWNHSGKTVATLTSGSKTSLPVGTQGAASPANTIANTDPITQMETNYDAKLTLMINQLQGIHSAVVMVTLDSTNQLSVAGNVKRTTQTQSGGSGQISSTSTTTDNSVFTEHTADGSSVPFVTRQVSPKVRGVVVMVDATDFFVAKSEIIDAIGHVLDVPAYKISVEPKRSNP